VELADTDARAWVALRPVGYQFPGGTDTADRNWLVIDGQLRHRRNQWTFEEACLTTLEAASLPAWLRSVASGDVEPLAYAAGATGRVPTLTFTEPNLAFSVAAYTDGAAVVRVHLSLESAPPWEAAAEIFDYHLELRLSADALRAAADAWEHDLLEFPPRP
jgi:hypothetical protein